MRFSRRTDNPAGTCHEIVAAMESMRREGNVELDLTRTDPTGWPERIALERKALATLVSDRSGIYCPDPQGILDTRRFLSAVHGGRIPENDWFLCASTSEAYSILFQLLCDPGDSVVVNRPSYPLLDDLARHGAVSLREVPLRPVAGHWRLDIGRLESTFKRDVIKAFCLIQPGNPTGWFLSDEERAKVLSLCAKHEVALVCDEVFADYVYSPGFRSLLGESKVLCFVLSGLSKGFGLPGYKLGWIGMSGPAMRLDEARERLQRINDSLLSASTPVQMALEPLWRLKEGLLAPIQDRLRTNLETWSRASVADSRYLRVDSGWMAILQLEAGEEEQACRLAMSRKILVQPGFLFDLPFDGVVLSLLSEPAVFREGLGVLQDIVCSL